MKSYISFLIFLCLILTLSGCIEVPSHSLPSVTIDVEFNKPTALDQYVLDNLKFEFTNISNSTTYSFCSEEGIKLIPGLYNISFSATTDSHDNSARQLRGFMQSVEVTGERMTIYIPIFIAPVSNDFVISEIFFAGTLQSSGNQYYGDDYIKIYNNTDKTLYADGLTIFESKFTTTQKYNYTPDIMENDVTVQALYTIPGNGTDFPILPGQYILIADTGIDHRVINPNSFNLSHADWEWYDISSVPSFMDIDSPTVPNLDKWYCYTQSFWLLHNRGFKAYGIARIPIPKQEYLKNYRYSYDYDIIVEAGSFPMSDSAYRIPNEWIVDMVNCSIASEFAWTVCHPSLDAGWTYCGTIDKDKTRYFHSVRRKMVALSPSGNPILQDTNNSTNDFNPFCTPSEIELQHSATDLYGSAATVITYDGVNPK
ncbi:MAG: DUF4876 domain-containing protein [Muribaculaceae bacterium]|nr:DUF4876 domain-containing protein [Muribaculaceae bacterium]